MQALEEFLRKMRRQRADWMNPVDDEILEYIDEAGAATPQSISDEIGKNNDYIGKRCRKLMSYGLLERPSRGLYVLTETGTGYLNTSVDASSLEEGD